TSLSPLSLHDALPISGVALGDGVTTVRASSPSSDDAIFRVAPALASDDFIVCHRGQMNRAGRRSRSGNHPAGKILYARLGADDRSEEHTSELQSRSEH